MIFTSTGSNHSSTMKGSGVNESQVIKGFSDFSPNFYDSITGKYTLINTFYKAKVKNGNKNATLYKTGSVRIFLDISPNSSSDAYSNDYIFFNSGVGESGVNVNINITKKVNSKGEFDYLYFVWTKPLFASANTVFNCALENSTLEYHYIPFWVDLIASTGGDISASISNHETNELSMTAIPQTGYHFVSWSDGVTTATRTVTITEDSTFYAEFAPNPYTINYYDSTSGTDVLVETKNCIYGIEYTHPALPTAENRIGYATNPKGWISNKSSSCYISYNGTEIKVNDAVQEQYSGTFSSFTSNNNEIVKLYFSYYPKQYKVNYTSYKNGGLNNYETASEYRIFNKNFSLKTLPSTTKGYKLTNKMIEEEGAIQNLTNYWFTSNTVETMTATSNKINSIAAESLANDINVFSYETPIDYQVLFHLIKNNQEISLNILKCKYNETYYTEEFLPFEEENYFLKGWYNTSIEDAFNWYIDKNGELVQGENIYSPGFPLNTSFSNLTETDQTIINKYCYYVPQAFYITYKWLDDFGNEDLLPKEQIRLYEGENSLISLIPENTYYIIDNEGTINWYYFENNDITSERLINTQTEFLSTDTKNYVFYGNKRPEGSKILFSSNDIEFGSIIIENMSNDNYYYEGDIITVYVSPTDIGYFDKWSDGSREPYRQIQVTQESINYEAIFRSNQVMGVRSILLGDNTPVKAIYKGVTPVYKE